jgi:hypothetical protein
MDHVDVVTGCLHLEIDDDYISITVPEGCPEGWNTSKIIVRLRNAVHGHKHAPELSHDDINA